jgi:hypothetical protein
MSEPKKLSIIQDFESPPGGWKYVVPETGIELKAPYAKSLKSRIAAHLNANGLPMPDSDVLDDAICRQSGHGEPWCGGAAPKVSSSLGQMITKSSVSRALRSVLQILRDRKFVSREEADHRMEVCKGCPFVSSLGLGCRSGCTEEIREMEKILGKKEDNVEPTCEKCGCFLRAKVWIPNSTLDKAEKSEGITYWDRCWRYEE